jgi:hypothetical protein
MARYRAKNHSPPAKGGCRWAHPAEANDYRWEDRLLRSPLWSDFHRQFWTAPGECAGPPGHSHQMSPPRLNKRLEPMRTSVSVCFLGLRFHIVSGRAAQAQRSP